MDLLSHVILCCDAYSAERSAVAVIVQDVGATVSAGEVVASLLFVSRGSPLFVPVVDFRAAAVDHSLGFPPPELARDRIQCILDS